jgi:hypothetical protein
MKTTIGNETMITQSEIRASFWEAHPEFKSEFKKSKRQNDYRTDIRCAFVDYVDYLRKDGQISDSLANRVTL